MSDNNIIHISLLGGCSLRYNGRTVDGNSLRSKKIWSLLSYLIVFRNKEVSQNDLIELIYSEDKSSNPMNALKTLMHRVRAALDELNYPGGGKALIQQQGGCYKWNVSVPVELDIDRFEALSSQAQLSGVRDEEILTCCQQAIDIYCGDFLPKFSMDPWVIPLNTYYRTRYIRLVHKAVDLLVQAQSNNEIVAVCQKAISVDPYDEFLYYNLVLALVNLGQTQDALTQYETTTKLFYKEFGVTPSAELQALYKQIIRSSQGVEMDINAVKEHLREDSESKGAFLCEYEFFKDIYRIEVRSASRTGKPVHLCLLTLAPQKGAQLTTKTLNTAMDKLMECVQKTLRRGDSFARYSVSQIVVMLPLTTQENADMVLNRIVKKYRGENPRSLAEITYSFQPIDVMM